MADGDTVLTVFSHLPIGLTILIAMGIITVAFLIVCCGPCFLVYLCYLCIAKLAQSNQQEGMEDIEVQQVPQQQNTQNNNMKVF